MHPVDRLRHHVTGAIERGEHVAIVEQPVILSEAQARQSKLCIGCRTATDCPGGLVCWQCFKYSCPLHPRPLKYSGLSFEEWQKS